MRRKEAFTQKKFSLSSTIDTEQIMAFYFMRNIYGELKVHLLPLTGSALTNHTPKTVGFSNAINCSQMSNARNNKGGERIGEKQGKIN